MRILVAGATGVIGKRVVPQLVQAGHEVWATTRRTSPPGERGPIGASVVQLDVLDRPRCVEVLERIRPEVVLHLVTDLAGRDFEMNNRVRKKGGPNLAEAAMVAGVRRMVVQSVAFAYAPGRRPALETDRLDIDSGGTHQALAEGIAVLEEAASLVRQWVSLRYGTLYGPGTWYSSDGPVAEAARRGELVATAGVTSFVHVDDAAASAVSAIDWPSGVVVNVVDNEPAPGFEWVPVFADAVGASSPPSSPCYSEWERGACNSLGRSLPGWQLHYPSWRTGFATSLR